MEIFKNANLRRNLAISLIILLTSAAAFGLVRLSIVLGEKEPIAIENYSPPIAAVSSSTEIVPKTIVPPASASGRTPAAMPKPAPPPTSEQALFIASKTGKRYYFPWCGTVKRIKKENQITFTSQTEAEKAGYTPGNCAGLK